MLSSLCFLHLLLLLGVPKTFQLDVDSPFVETKLGKIRGSTLISQYGAIILAFRGIPYAEPPIGNLRFQSPKPVVAWQNTLNATEDSLICPQPGKPELMSEDCLKLNVYTRNLVGKAPVIVYIHGGGNVVGSGHSLYDSGPQYLMDHDVVFVSFNYRLGALGFLSTGTKEAPGNFAYLDQILALEWVREHIANFGGNPELVTIFGFSVGSMAVSLHMASPLSRNLFHRAICMSGSATSHYSIDNQALTRKLAHDLACPMYNPQDLVDCMRSLDWQTIVNGYANWSAYKFKNTHWNYEIDGHFLLAHPTEIFRSGDFNSVPLLVGISKNDFDFSVYHQENNTGLLHDLSVNFDKYAPELFQYNAVAEKQTPPVSQRIWQEYFDAETEINKENLLQFGELCSDSIIRHGVHRLVDLNHRHGSVYYYRMDYVGSQSQYLNSTGQPRGIGHGDDLQYILPSFWDGTQLPLKDPDMFMMQRMTKWWTTFAKNGVPLSEYEGQWQPTTIQSPHNILYIDRVTHMGKEPYAKRYALWDDMFPIRSAATSFNASMLTALLFSAIVLSVIK